MVKPLRVSRGLQLYSVYFLGVILNPKKVKCVCKRVLKLLRPTDIGELLTTNIGGTWLDRTGPVLIALNDNNGVAVTVVVCDLE